MLVFGDVVNVVFMIVNLSALVWTLLLLLFGTNELVVLQSLGRSTNRDG